jgi:hypothetical protein
MELKGKALYNLLKINALDNPKISSAPWQIEDLSALSTSKLFERLKHLNLALDENSFLLYANEADSPEELTDYVWVNESDEEGRERAYLLLFELWRRLLPEKQSLSIFCDTCDQLIDQYDRGVLEDEEGLENALCILEDILDDACDSQQLNPQEAFAEIARHCAHDLESFLYDYIAEQIEAEDQLYASELIDAFYDFVSDKKWFDFLRARLFFSERSDESNLLIERLLEQLREEPDVHLLLEIVDSLVHYGHIDLFRQAVKQALPLLKTEKEFRELLKMSGEYFRCLDKEKEEKAIHELLATRSQISTDSPFHASDKNLMRFYDLL